MPIPSESSIELITNGLFLLIFVLLMGIYVSKTHYLEKYAILQKSKWLYMEKEISLVAGKHVLCTCVTVSIWVVDLM